MICFFSFGRDVAGMQWFLTNLGLLILVQSEEAWEII
jgi:hypothetical protein